MKIAFIRKKYTFHGGSERFTSLLLEKLLESGSKVVMYAINWDKTINTNPNLVLKRIPVLNLGSFLRDITFITLSYILLKREKEIDIIQTHDKTLFQDIYRAGDGCHKTYLKIRWNYGNFWEKLSLISNPWHWLILIIERIIFNGRRYKKIIAISRMVKDNILENYKVNPTDIEIIYNGVDLMRFSPENRDKYREDTRRKYSISSDEFVVLFVGSDFKRKGLDYLIKAVNLIPTPITLMVVGRGNIDKFLKNNKNQRIIFCGAQREIERYYASADIFVFPTLYEPFGNVHLEALASGLPVITSKNSGASEIITNGVHGFVVSRPESIEELSECIVKFMDSDFRVMVSRNARELSKNFDINLFADRMISLYDEILRDKKG